MTPNPYQAPREPSGEPNQTGSVVLRVFAVVAWLAALLWGAFYTLSFHGDGGMARHRAEEPWMYAAVVCLVFVIPICGFLLLGFAGWFRKWWLAVPGIFAVTPLVFLFVNSLQKVLFDP
jgi:hypothetical protein